MTCRASVVIPTYNRRELLRLTLDSLVRQELDSQSFEVIVIDDGSTDGSSELAQAFANRLNLCTVRQEHLGFRVARARNLGIERAHGDILIFVDSGMILGSRSVSSHLAAHQHGDGTPVAVIGYVHGYDFNIQSPELTKAHNLGSPDADSLMAAMDLAKTGRDIREPVYLAIRDHIETLPAPWTLFWTTNVSVSSHALRAAGGFDEDFVQWGMEDIDLGFRLWRKGTRFVLSRKAAGIHYPHERDNAANLRSHAENRQLFARKNPSIETEAFLASDPLRFNFELQHYRSHESSRKAWAEQVLGGELVRRSPELARLGEVVFGFGDGHWLGLCNSRAGIEADNSMVEAARRSYPTIDIRTHLGIRTAFKHRQFATCLVAGAALGLPRSWLGAMMAETTRIAARAHVLDCDGERNPSELQGANLILSSDRFRVWEIGRSQMNNS